MRAVFMPQEDTVPSAKPKGGYQLIAAVHLAVAWWCYRQKRIRLVDLRVWFACWEQRARRCGRSRLLPCRYRLGELERLTGLSSRRLQESLLRLAAAQLLSWSESAVEFPAWTESVPPAERDAFGRFLDQIANHRRRVPVPRRILRLLAGGARPALIATILGHVLRCLYLKDGECTSRGRVKASLIAKTFGVGLRRVKEARRELVALGWLIPLAARQWELNRWGAHVQINLDWSRLDGLKTGAEAPAGGAEMAPPAPHLDAESAPPESDMKPLWDDKNQKPAVGGPTGVFSVEPEEKTTQPAQVLQPVATPASALPEESPPVAPIAAAGASRPGKADWRHLLPEDLRDTGRLLDLYDQAVGLGLAAASEWGRLRFVAAAEHARVIGTKNPCGLFVRLVRGGLWHFATGDDEEAASVRLRRHLHGDALPRQAEPAVPRRRVEELSDDARLVRALRELAARQGLRADPFPLLKREKPEWTRERWDAAVAELNDRLAWAWAQ